MDDLKAKLYRHIEVQDVACEPDNTDLQTQRLGYTPFSTKRDLFSVGMILLELGIQRSVMRTCEAATYLIRGIREIFCPYVP